MTAFDTDETILKCLSLGAAGYIAKGQDPESIIRSLSEKIPFGNDSLSREHYPVNKTIHS